MTGFTRTLTDLDENYLWNWWDLMYAFPGYGTLYGWDATIQNWDMQTPFGASLIPGEGYWIPFESNGYIYP